MAMKDCKQTHIWLPIALPSTLERVDLIIPRHVSAADFDFILAQIRSFREGLTGEPEPEHGERALRLKALEELAQQAQELDMGYDPPKSAKEGTHAQA